MYPDNVDDFVERALILEIAASSGNDADIDLLWDWLGHARSFGQLSMDRALELLRCDEAHREVGYDLIAVLCNPDEHEWTQTAVEAMAEAFAVEVPALHWSVANALNYCCGAPTAAPVLLWLVQSDDRNVRLRATQALAGTEDFAPEKHPWRDPVVNALVLLMCDPDAEVRNWATFVLGRQLTDDTAATRSALLERSEDDDVSVRIEAVCGLAQHRDPRATPRLVQLLVDGHDNLELFSAAQMLADPKLHDALSGIERVVPDPVVDAELAAAVSGCRPGRLGEEVAVLTKVLGGLQRRLDAAHEVVRVTASCWRTRLGVTVDVDDPEDASRCHTFNLDWFIDAFRIDMIEARMDRAASDFIDGVLPTT